MQFLKLTIFLVFLLAFAQAVPKTVHYCSKIHSTDAAAPAATVPPHASTDNVGLTPPKPGTIDDEAHDGTIFQLRSVRSEVKMEVNEPDRELRTEMPDETPNSPYLEPRQVNQDTVPDEYAGIVPSECDWSTGIEDGGEGRMACQAFCRDHFEDQDECDGSRCLANDGPFFPGGSKKPGRCFCTCRCPEDILLSLQ
ncbi:hypothetical protein UCRNP2_6781 [Neofusicoccum parvum UCRNP2]|uniref:Uncharacterized protein n=1 Tax=Botryosphaeria parva (strain UCR-NP2) TaxID=1287680 RepID=R1GKF4_BOTPV|nr:hypothetical protein UCRNP2_6781 [Neofusicoccum parvum UCRNP2]